jgi:hypothetical protein
MVNGGRVRSWLCVNFARNVQESIANGFCRELARMCQASGMASIPEVQKLHVPLHLLVYENKSIK